MESLIDWRALHDPEADGRLLRLSVGVEHVEDLRRDLERGFARVAAGGEVGSEGVEEGRLGGEGGEGGEKEGGKRGIVRRSKL